MNIADKGGFYGELAEVIDDPFRVGMVWGPILSGGGVPRRAGGLATGYCQGGFQPATRAPSLKGCTTVAVGKRSAAHGFRDPTIHSPPKGADHDILCAGYACRPYNTQDEAAGLPGDDAEPGTAAAGAIVAGCATLAVMVLVRMNRKVDFETLSVELAEITVVCPRCGKKQAIPVGGAICAGCKLRISITIEEPRCPKCDYLLYGLPSDRCPECGTRIAALPANSPAEPDRCGR